MPSIPEDNTAAKVSIRPLLDRAQSLLFIFEFLKFFSKMFVFFCVCLIFLSLGRLETRVLTSRQTPFDSAAVFSQAISAIPTEVTAALTFVSALSDIREWEEAAIIDCLYDYRLSDALQKVTDRRLYLKLWSEPSLFAQQFGIYARALNLTRVTVISTIDQYSLTAAQTLVDSDPSTFTEILTLPTSPGMDLAKQFVARMIKPRGVNQVGIITDSETAFQLLSALNFSRMLRPGYFYLLSDRAAYCRILYAQNLSEVFYIADQFAVAGDRNAAEAAAIASVLQTYASTGVLKSPIRRYSLFAFSNSTAKSIVSSPAELLSRSNLTSTPLIPQLSQATIRASINYDVINPNFSEYELGRQLMRGVKVAFDEVNNRTDVIPEHYMEDFSVGFTGMDFSYNLSKSRILEGKSDLGLVYITTPISNAIAGIYRIFSELNLTVPILAGSLDSALSDSKSFPHYLRPRSSSRYIAHSVARFMRLWNWRQAAVLYSADHGNEDAYAIFLEVAAQLSINVSNSPESRKLPSVLDNSTAAQVNFSLAEIQQSTTRIILIIHVYSFVVLEQMYDLGMRGEYAILLISGLIDAAYKDPTHYKRRVVSKGAISLLPKVFVGQVGSRVKQELLKRDGDGMYSSTCFLYDASYLYFYSIDYLLQRGLDYEDPFVLVKAMRETHFQGCAGSFRIETGSNDRIPGEITITNFQYDNDKDIYELKEVGSYNPFSAQLYHFTGKIQWPDEKDTYADLKPMYENCPFLRDEVHSSPLSLVLTTVLICMLFVYAFLTSCFLVRRLKSLQISPLRTRCVESQEDRFQISAMAVDCLQIAALGPDLRTLSDFLASLASASAFHLEDQSCGTMFWAQVNVALGLVGLLALSFLFKAAGRKFAAACCNVDYYIGALIPTILYQPIVSALEGVFMCRMGVSDQLTGSFLDADCLEFCWTGRHLGYAIGALCALLLFLPFAVLAKLLWQELQPSIHIKLQPMAVLFKSLLQVFLISILHLLKPTYTFLHALLFFAANIGNAALMLKFSTYNYSRLNLWQGIANTATLSLCLGGCISTLTEGTYNERIWTALGLELFVLVGVGVLVQRFDARFEGMLKQERDKDVRGLFIFAFTMGKRAQAGLETYYRANNVLTHSRYSIGPDDQYEF